MRTLARALLAFAVLSACGDDDRPAVDGGALDAAPLPPDAAAGACTPARINLALDEIGRGFGTPTDIKSPPGDTRIFVASKDGFVSIVDGDDNVLKTDFLDLRDQVDTISERGLLGLAFHPDHAQNRRFFVFYTQTDGTITIAEGKASATDPDVAEAELTPLVTHPHLAGNHNGGWLDFGPDGYLYATVGDNAQGGDTALDTDSLLGKVLRLDVSTPGEVKIPADNPFAAGGGRPEVWAYGLRNPWRASFDAQTGDFYLADVGQNTYEEVNVQAAGAAGGRNYGWNTMEGTHCHSPQEGCDTSGLTLPVHEYAHPDSGGSITGGYVYRAGAIPDCAGTYFFADYSQRRVMSFRWQGGAGVVDVVEDWPSLSEGTAVTTFGVDADGELLLGDGDTLWRLVKVTDP